MTRTRAVALVGVCALAACAPSHRFDDYVDPSIHDAPPRPDGPDVRRFVEIPSGVSIQGDPLGSAAMPPSFDGQPVHRVFTSGFKIGAACVDQGWYDECVAANGCAQADISTLPRDQAAAFCAWLGMRLPTEAELERAMRGDVGGTTTNPSAYGLDACGFGERGIWTADNYRCDAYVDRAWANPQETAGLVPHYRRFADALGLRSLPATQFGVRCAATLDLAVPPAPPVHPTCTSGSCEVTGLAAGDRFGCALRADGSVWCWGSNADGALGTGERFDAMPASQALPVVLDPVAAIAAGARFACARAGAVVSCWGANNLGQIGGHSGPASTPVVVTTDATALAAAGDHGCVVDGAGGVACWGRGAALQGGSGPTSVTPTGITGATAIAAGVQSDCAIVGGTVQCWGVVHDATGVLGYVSPSTPRTFAITASAIAVGTAHACAVVGTTVRCWGDRTAWGGAGVATTPEALAGTFVAPRVFAAPRGVVVVDQGAIVIDVATRLPGTLAIDGDAIAFTADAGDGCASTGAGATCFGAERGALGRSNGCDASVSTSALVLP